MHMQTSEAYVLLDRAAALKEVLEGEVGGSWRAFEELTAILQGAGEAWRTLHACIPRLHSMRQRGLCSSWRPNGPAGWAFGELPPACRAHAICCTAQGASRASLAGKQLICFARSLVAPTPLPNPPLTPNPWLPRRPRDRGGRHHRHLPAPGEGGPGSVGGQRAVAGAGTRAPGAADAAPAAAGRRASHLHLQILLGWWFPTACRERAACTGTAVAPAALRSVSQRWPQSWGWPAGAR